jgi:hypothetical protein
VIRISAIFLALLLSGCAYIPWRPFGSPITRSETAAQRVEEAKDRAGAALVEEVYKVSAAIDAASAGSPHGVAVARSHATTAKTLATQIFGPPQVVDEAKWRDLIDRQTSLDDHVRALADAENTKRIGQIAVLSKDLAMKDAALDEANAKVLKYAAEKEAIADKFLKFCWVVGGLFALYFLGQFLQLLASFNPAFQSAANLVNTFVSPVLHSGFSKARKAAAAVRD